MNIEKTLIELGLSKNAARIYCHLLKQKGSTISQVALKTHLSRPTVYTNLAQLEDLGLVAENIVGKQKLWKVENPNYLHNILRTKGEKLKNILPLIMSEFSQHKEEPKIKFHYGKEGAKKLLDETLESKDKLVRAFGSWAMYKDLLGMQYAKNYWQKRMKHKVAVQMIDSRTSRKDYALDKEFSEIGNIKWNREIRIAPPGFKFDIFIMVFDNKVLFFAPLKEGYAFSFESPSFANTLKSWFSTIWQMSESLH